MRLRSLEVSNFRCLGTLSISAGGKSLLVVGENATGKSALLTAAARALGRDSTASQTDFADLSQPIEIVVTLEGFDAEDQGSFPSELSFQGTPTLRIGYRAVWSPSEREAEITIGFPDLGWKRATRDQKDALPVLWYPAWRDPSKLLHLSGARSVLAQLLGSLKLDASLDAALAAISGALGSLGTTPELATLLGAARASLAGIIPGVSSDAFSLSAEGSDSRSLLAAFDLLLEHSGPALPVSQQSSGLAQLATFAFALQAMAREPKALLLVDEPEISLHPQAQRALVGLIRRLPNQSILATHSSSVLDRADLRTLVRLHRATASVEAAHAGALTEEQATRLARFANPQTTEACFARKVIFVEGYSDRIILLQLAQRLQRDLDAEGVSVLSLEGGAGIGAHLSLLGPTGIGLRVLGLCDEDKETHWIKELNKAGIAASDRASLKVAGFFVCASDLEQEFIRALGIAGTEAVIAHEGQAHDFAKFAAQPQQAGLVLEEQLRRYLHNANTRWAAPLVAALDLTAIPGPLAELLANA